ncbi:MAG: TolC family protein [Bacteroidales bacterium]|nr:TolC family protein [Bacteroidales bacterium]
MMNPFRTIKTIGKGVIALVMSVSVSALSGQELLTIDRSMKIAVENSPDMQQTELSLVQSQERLNAQRARLKSQFSVTLNPFEYEKTNRFDQQTSEWYLNESASSGGSFAINQRILPTDGEITLVNRFSYDYSYTESAHAVDPVSKTFNNRLYLQVTQPIFTYNRTRMELEKVELDYEASLLRYLLMKLFLERDVTREFYTVYSNQMQLVIAQEELENNLESYGIINNKVEGGLLALEELYQAEVNLATSKSNVFNSELNLQNSMDQFKVLIGIPLQNGILIAAEIKADTVGVNQELAIEHALNNRMELRQREIDIENASFNLVQAKSINEFAGSVSASFGVQANNEFFNSLFETPTNTPSIGLTLSVPIFDWGERKSEIKAAEAGFQSSQLDYQIERTGIEVNIRSVVRNLKNLENQIVIQRKTIENAQLAYDINLERYRNGDLTSLDLGLYQSQLSDTKMALTNAIIEYKIELLNLKIQTLYDFEEQTPIIPEELMSKSSEKE